MTGVVALAVGGGSAIEAISNISPTSSQFSAGVEASQAVSNDGAISFDGVEWERNSKSNLLLANALQIPGVYWLFNNDNYYYLCIFFIFAYLWTPCDNNLENDMCYRIRLDNNLI